MHDLQVFGVEFAPFLADTADETSTLSNREQRKSRTAGFPVEVFSVSSHAVATARGPQPDVVGRLAKFFPEATPVRIPVKLSRREGKSKAFFQDTVIEFGTSREVLFALDRPLEFADRVLLENADGSLRAEASGVAVQYHPNRTVVAARFLKDVPNWIVKP